MTSSRALVFWCHLLIIPPCLICVGRRGYCGVAIKLSRYRPRWSSHIFLPIRNLNRLFCVRNLVRYRLAIYIFNFKAIGISFDIHGQLPSVGIFCFNFLRHSSLELNLTWFGCILLSTYSICMVVCYPLSLLFHSSLPQHKM